MAKIAACLIVKNEEKYIERILDTLTPHTDGVFIYDTGSTDSTTRIARSKGSYVVEGEWVNDFSWARNRSFLLPPEDFDWIMYADADDEIDGLHRLRPLAEDAISSVSAFRFPYHNDWSGVHINYHTIRMVRRSSGYRWRYPLHEQLYTDGPEHVVTRDDIIWSQKHTWKDRQKKTQRNLDFLLEYTKNSGLSDWLASAIVLTMIEQGRAREAHQWMMDNNYVMDIHERT